MITDVGSLYADKVHKPSLVPHLEDNLGSRMGGYGFMLGAALVPATTVTSTPAVLKNLTIQPARFSVVQPYVELGTQSINRLAPIPGLLGYEYGKPVDLRTGKRAD